MLRHALKKQIILRFEGKKESLQHSFQFHDSHNTAKTFQLLGIYYQLLTSAAGLSHYCLPKSTSVIFHYFFPQVFFVAFFLFPLCFIFNRSTVLCFCSIFLFADILKLQFPVCVHMHGMELVGSDQLQIWICVLLHIKDKHSNIRNI